MKEAILVIVPLSIVTLSETVEIYVTDIDPRVVESVFPVNFGILLYPLFALAFHSKINRAETEISLLTSLGPTVTASGMTMLAICMYLAKL